jgi:hypothetical protein
MVDHDRLVNLYNTHRPMDPYGRGRMTFEEFLIAMNVEGALPPRRTENLRPLKDFLSDLIFNQQALEIPVPDSQIKIGDEPHHYYAGKQTVIQPSALKQALGEDYAIRYSFRDWTTAIEEVLVEHNCPKHCIEFGTRYRVGFNWSCSEGGEGIFINIDPALLKLCRSTPKGTAGIAR